MMRLGRAPCCYCFTEPHPAGGVAAAVRLRVLPPARAANTSSEPAARLRAVLEQVDEELRKGNDEAALSLVRGSQGADGGLRFFGAARQVGFCCHVNICPDDVSRLLAAVMMMHSPALLSFLDWSIFMCILN